MRRVLARIERGNVWLADRITTVVGSMWAAYGFTVLALVSLPAALATHDAVVIVGWVAQTFLQLVLLPVIMVGQAIQQQKHDLLAAEHQVLAAQHAEVLSKVSDIHERVAG